MNPSPMDHLDGLLSALMLAPEKLDSRTRIWIISGLIEFLRSGERLDACLGLSGRGVRTLRTQVLQLERDTHLLNALKCICPTPAPVEWKHCVRLSKEVGRFMAGAWPQSRGLMSPPARFSDYQRHLWHAARLGQPMPENARHYYNLLQANEAYSFQNRRPRMLSRYLIPSGPTCNALPSLASSTITPSRS